jgi:GNAT superfamily N-acetyltransferase
MTLRTARPADAPAIAVLATQLGYPSRPEQIEERLRDVLARPDGAVLVADEGGTVIGWGHVAGTHTIETEPFATILALVVDEGRRGLGTGAALVQALTEWAAAQGYRTLRVRSNVVRDRAHAFYERLGFSRLKTQHAFSRPLA